VWLGLLLVAVLGVSGCKQWGLHDDEPYKEGLRRNDLSEPARQVRAIENPDKAKKPADDPWMSHEAQKIYRDLD
jgi:hypothetical protein